MVHVAMSKNYRIKYAAFELGFSSIFCAFFSSALEEATIY
jgi:hypothetical protein